MEHNLYEVLGLARDASPEQIRKAYRKKALETHPDRLPPDATDADKSASAEKFRAVNNAYEVLIEPKNRRTYDLHGVWPPPEHNNDEPHHRSSRHRYEPSSHQYQTYSSPFPDNMFPPFSSGLFGERHPRSHFVFTDPFALFDSIFGDFPRAGPVGLFQFPPRHAEHHSRRHEYLGHPADEHHHYEDPGRDGYTGPHHRRHTHSQGSSYPPMQAFFQSESHGYGSHGRWTQESKVTTTVNGVSQSVWKRTDADVSGDACSPRADT
jgi:DnaJ family protein B protein 6